MQGDELEIDTEYVHTEYYYGSTLYYCDLLKYMQWLGYSVHPAPRLGTSRATLPVSRPIQWHVFLGKTHVLSPVGLVPLPPSLQMHFRLHQLSMVYVSTCLKLFDISVAGRWLLSFVTLLLYSGEDNRYRIYIYIYIYGQWSQSL